MRRVALAVGVGAAVGALAGALFATTAGVVSRVVSGVCRVVDRWRTWQAASPEKRAQMKKTLGSNR